MFRGHSKSTSAPEEGSGKSGRYCQNMRMLGFRIDKIMRTSFTDQDGFLAFVRIASIEQLCDVVASFKSRRNGKVTFHTVTSELSLFYV